MGENGVHPPPCRSRDIWANGVEDVAPFCSSLGEKWPYVRLGGENASGFHEGGFNTAGRDACDGLEVAATTGLLGAGGVVEQTDFFFTFMFGTKHIHFMCLTLFL